MKREEAENAYRAIKMIIEDNGWGVNDFDTILLAYVARKSSEENEAVNTPRYFDILVKALPECFKGLVTVYSAQKAIKGFTKRIHEAQRDLYPRHASSSFYNYHSDMQISENSRRIKELKARIEKIKSGDLE